MSQIITIDCDNVLADTAGSFVNRYIRVTWRELSLKDLNQQYLSQCSALAWMCENKWDPYFPFWKSILAWEHTMKPIPWAVDAITSLHDQWYILKVVTGRWTMERDETYRWLEEHFPKMFNEVIFGFEWTNDFTNKWVLCSRLNTMLHIDDFIENGKDISAVWIPMILFDRLWNQSDEKNALIIRTQGWEDSLSRIRENLWSQEKHFYTADQLPS